MSEHWQRMVDNCQRHTLVQTKGERRFLAYLAEIKRITAKERAKLMRIVRKLRALGY